MNQNSTSFITTDGLTIAAQVVDENFGGVCPEPEGQLAVDVAQTENEIMVAATMAGTPPDRIELHLHSDVLTIRGFRQSPLPANAEAALSECYWGKFSRTIVLPAEVRPELARAEYKNGALIIYLNKVKTDSTIPIYVVD